MKRIALAAALTLGSLPALAADLTPQTISTVKVDVAAVSNGYRGSKVIGATIANDANENIGKVDDLLVARNDRVLYAVVSVGGFLGIGDKLVVVPYSALQVSDTKMVLPGATKDALKALPKFEYQKR